MIENKSSQRRPIAYSKPYYREARAARASQLLTANLFRKKIYRAHHLRYHLRNCTAVGYESERGSVRLARSVEKCMRELHNPEGPCKFSCAVLLLSRCSPTALHCSPLLSHCSPLLSTALPLLSTTLSTALPLHSTNSIC